jgi:hypothetical protein
LVVVLLGNLSTVPVFIKANLLKEPDFKLIGFQGLSQTFFLESSVIHLTFIRIKLSTITREDILEDYFMGGGGGGMFKK